MSEQKTMSDASPASRVIVVGPGDGRVVQRPSSEQTIIKVADADTRGAYALRENVVPPRSSGVPFHIHRDAEEAFYVLSGALTVYAADQTLAAPAGSFVLIPRGMVHSLANWGAEPVRSLTIISPAWVSRWIEEESDLLRSASNGSPDASELHGLRMAIYERFGLEVAGPPPPPPDPRAGGASSPEAGDAAGEAGPTGYR
jgi:mannose-6-phosphate isomerase-like protein (cupin superfamily)